MKISRWILALVLVCAVAGGTPTLTRADEQALAPMGDQDSLTPTEGLEHWWGVAGAVLCGGEGLLLRTNPVVGLNPYVMAAGIAGCCLALLDCAR